MLKNKRILITGGAGFIGSYLCERLINDNEVVIYDNCHRNALKYTGLEKNKNMTFVKADILDSKKIIEVTRGCDVVIHLAAIAGIDTVIKKPIVTMKINMLGTYNALEAAVANKVKLFINFSTSEVYGPYTYKGTEASMTTQGEVGKMRWTYAVSKLAAEHLAHCYYQEYGIAFSSVRPFNIYGPRQIGEGAIHKFIALAVNDEDIVIYGDGTQIRAWCYIDDFVNGITLILSNKKAIGQVFNIGNPQSTVTMLKLAKRVIELGNSSSRIVFKESSMPDVEVRVPSIKKAQEVLGFNPSVSLDDGIRKTFEWYRGFKK